MPRNNDNDNDHGSVFGIPVLIFAVLLFLFVLFLMYNVGFIAFPKSMCPTCAKCASGAANTVNANANASTVNANANAVNAVNASFADGVVANVDNMDTCAMFGGAPNLEDPGVMFDQHPLIEFCITNCDQYVDALNRAAYEDAALSEKIVSDPDNSLWEMRQQYYTIYLEALEYVGQDLGCTQ